MSIWSKIPSQWVQLGGLRNFSARTAGRNAAALKLYMGIAMFANFKPTPLIDVGGFARLSYSELEELCNISRRYVQLGLETLVQKELITVVKVSNANGYLLLNYDVPGWAKLPKAYLLQKATYSSLSRFANMSIRGALHLEALKLYMTLISFRNNSSATALISYDKIENYTAIPRGRVRRSIDVLINHEWISLGSHNYEESTDKPTNAYILRGDFWGKRRQTYARASGVVPELATKEDFADIDRD